MTDLDVRRSSDANYLRKALAWVELRLRRLAAGRGCEDLPQPSLSLAELAEGDLVDDVDAQIQHLAALMEEASWSEPSPRFVELAERMELSDFESALLLLCVGMEMEAVISALCASPAAGRGGCPDLRAGAGPLR